ncbi:hypothetical protein OC844_004912 [Tilletia horrida]|nr:hypothetical protein OC844_004912 [Tilletia horrida]
MLSRLSAAVDRKLNLKAGTGSSSTAPGAGVGAGVAGGVGAAAGSRSSSNLAPLAPEDEAHLRALGVPLCAHAQACHDCPEPCDDDDTDGAATGPPAYLQNDPRQAGQLRLWAKQEIDLSPAPLLSIAHPQPFHAHVLVSTEGKTDWVREVSELKGSLAETWEKFSEADERAEEEALKAGTGKLLDTIVKKAKGDSSSSGGGGGGGDDEGEDASDEQRAGPEGVWSTTSTSTLTSTTATRVLYQNSSHFSTSSGRTNASGIPHHTLLLFPAFQLLTNVPAPERSDGDDERGNERLLRAIWDRILRGAPPGPLSPGNLAEEQEAEDWRLIREQGVRRWVLPYRAVVLLCSHKKRDARCAIAASLLSASLRHHAEEAGWTVDERGDASSVVGHDSSATDPDEEDGSQAAAKWGALTLREAEDSENARRWRRLASEGRGPDDHDEHDGEGGNESGSGGGTLGIFQISHIGGHKYSGNVIIYFPTGAGVWYGRVSPVRDAKAVFEKTIRQGIVIPEFLRAGINLVRPSTSSPSPGPAAQNGAGAGAAPTTLVSGTREELIKEGVLPRGSLVRW